MDKTIYAAYVEALNDLNEAEADFVKYLHYQNDDDNIDGVDYYDDITSAQKYSAQAYERVKAARLLLY
jgi:hypothetical protein